MFVSAVGSEGLFSDFSSHHGDGVGGGGGLSCFDVLLTIVSPSKFYDSCFRFCSLKRVAMSPFNKIVEMPSLSIWLHAMSRQKSKL